MIDKKDIDLLNYLMESDFDADEITPEEMRKMLKFFRKYVRIVHSSKKSLEFKIIELDKKIEYKDLIINKLEHTQSSIERKMDKNENRKLTWRERLLGKLR